MAYTTINKPSEHFNTKLYTGNGGTNALTGVGFEPSLTWIKCRDDTHNPNWFDAVRGVTKRISSHSTAAESTVANSLTSFNNDGFTLGASGGENSNNNTYASWNWKAGTTSGQATNSYSTITPTSISFNQTSGFSIIKYTGNATAGAGVPHGLGVAPKMVIVKNLDSSSYGWYCYHVSLGATKSLYLHNSDAEVTSNDRWNGWLPDATNVSLGTNAGTNGSNNMIMYCFAEKTGYSKIGSYTGNGSADGSFVYTGFKPAFLMVKRTDSADNWTINDNKRVGYNVDNNELFANLSNAEDTNDVLDLVSNGFKLRHTAGRHNTSGGTYIYMAFAEAPLVGSNGVTAKAR
jgi:hypothetical protein